MPPAYRSPLKQSRTIFFSIVHVFLRKVCQKGVLVNKEFEANMTHVWMNDSLVIHQFLYILYLQLEWLVNSTGQWPLAGQKHWALGNSTS